jgi:hypothetical protein
MCKTKIFSLFTISLLFLSFGVYAAGSGTTPSDSNSTDTNSTTNETGTDSETEEEINEVIDRRPELRRKANRVRAAIADIKVAAAEDLRKCDEFEDRQDRIKCRLIRIKEGKHGEDEGENNDYTKRIPEACAKLAEKAGKDITTKQQCGRLYNAIQPCYKLDDKKSKLRCFKRHTLGENKKHPSDSDPEKVRHYIVTLLYDLQERIEHSLEDGAIKNEEKASEVINQIVLVKEAIMNGEKKDVVKPLILELRTKLRELRASQREGTE